MTKRENPRRREKECISKALEMIAEGFPNVVPFQFEKRRKKDEEFDWKYVKEHRLVMKWLFQKEKGIIIWKRNSNMEIEFITKI